MDGSQLTRAWWKLVTAEEQRLMNSKRFFTECKRHCVRAWRIWPKCVIRVCPTVEMIVGFIPCYCDQITHSKSSVPSYTNINGETIRFHHILNKDTHYSRLSRNWSIVLLSTKAWTQNCPARGSFGKC